MRYSLIVVALFAACGLACGLAFGRDESPLVVADAVTLAFYGVFLWRRSRGE